MKYMLMMNTMKAGTGGLAWPQKDLRAHVAFMMGLNKELRESGELVFAEGLSFPDQAKLVRAGKNGLPITDGVFPESKEFLAGYWIVDVDSPERAYTIAAKASAAPGPGGPAARGPAPRNFRPPKICIASSMAAPTSSCSAVGRVSAAPRRRGFCAEDGAWSHRRCCSSSTSTICTMIGSRPPGSSTSAIFRASRVMGSGARARSARNRSPDC